MSTRIGDSLPMKKEPSIWVLKTHSVGDTHNALAVALALSPHNTRLIEPEEFDAELPNSYAAQIHTDGTPPDIFFTHEQVSSRYSQRLKALSKGSTFVVGLQAPDIDNNDFDKKHTGGIYDYQIDHQLVYRHLSSSTSGQKAPNDRTVLDRVPTRIGLTDAHTSLNATLQKAALHKPAIMVSLGSIVHPTTAYGHSNYQDYAEEMDEVEENLRTLLREAAAKAKETGGSVLLSTSRRSYEAFSDTIDQELSGVAHYVNDWHKSGGADQYENMLQLADHLVVSADSISMLSDALALGKPTYIFVPSRRGAIRDVAFASSLANTDMIKPEVRDYMLNLCAEGVIHPLESLLDENVKANAPLNNAEEIAAAVRDAYEAHRERGEEKQR